MLKYFSSLLILVILSFPAVALATFDYGYDITNISYDPYDPSKQAWTVPSSPEISQRLNDNYMYGNKNYPLVGLTDYGPIFLDITSCTYTVQNGNAILACLVYYGSGGSDGKGNAAHYTPEIIKFCTYKTDKRVIKLLSVVNFNTGYNYTQLKYKTDNGFLINLFWLCAKYTNQSENLDN